jgi:integrase
MFVNVNLNTIFVGNKQNIKIMKNIFQVWELYLDYSKQHNVEATYSFKCRVRDYAKEVVKSHGITEQFESIDNRFFDKFIQYCQKEGYSDNTVGKYVKGVKEFVNWSIDSQFANRKYYSKVKISKVSKDIVVYSEQELQSIINLNLSDNPKLSLAKDIMVFGCFTGLRVSDLLSVKKTNVVNGVLKVSPGKTQKSGKVLSIPLAPAALEVYERYQNTRGERLFPFISDRTFASRMVDISKLAGIGGTEEVHTLKGGKVEVNLVDRSTLFSPHRLRATFITIMLKSGVPAEQVMKLSGHSSYSSFQRYVTFTRDDNDKAINKAFGAFG